MLRVRWLGRVPFDEAFALQVALRDRATDDHLLLLEHPHVFSLGLRADPAHVLVDPAEVGASMVRTNRGGDVTYHGPGQLVAYPIVTVPTGPRAIPCHVHAIEQIVIDTLSDFGLAAGRLDGYPGVWVEPEGPTPRKICAIGIRVGRRRSMHGLALNVDPDLDWFSRIVPCGIADKAVTSMGAEGVVVSMAQVVDALVDRGAAYWAPDGDVERQDVAWTKGAGASKDPVLAPVVPAPTSAPERHMRIRLRQAGVEPSAGLPLNERKPPWLRIPARMGDEFLSLRSTVRGLGLVTVCEEAGCPNIFECWADGTATFMINGDRCTRACGFCLVDTQRPLAIDPDEPAHVADAVERLGLAHAVVTAVARDDLGDGGAPGFVATIDAIRRRCPSTSVEVLIPDCKGDERSLRQIFDAHPDVLNHNVETVARLHRAVRPSAGYARSLAVLARAKNAGLTTKSGLMVGLGETREEIEGALADIRGVGTDIVTVGQYLRPSAAHLPVQRWWEPAEFESLRATAYDMGFSHVEASPLTRSSYHARQAAAAVPQARPRVGASHDLGFGGGEVTMPTAATPGADPAAARKARLARVRARMVELDVDAVLLSHGADLPWLTGYRAMPLERLTLLILPVAGDAVLVVPALEAPRVPHVGGPDDALFTLRPWLDDEDPIVLASAIIAAASKPRPTLAISDRAWATSLLALQQRLPEARWAPASTVTSPLRAVKDAAEIEVLRAAGQAADRVAEALQAGEIKLLGRTESEVSDDIAARLLAAGHRRVNFAIVGSGPNGASPHHSAGSRRIDRGDVVVCDFGGELVATSAPDADPDAASEDVGYCSDITRTVVVGDPTSEVRDCYEVLRAAQHAAVAAVAVGVAAADIDAAARAVITDAGLGERFIHRTGHGIGIEEHEDPYVVAGNLTPLQVGHAFSIEPGIYLPGRFGMRLEDIVVVSEAGADPLNTADHAMVVVDV